MLGPHQKGHRLKCMRCCVASWRTFSALMLDAVWRLGCQGSSAVFRPTYLRDSSSWKRENTKHRRGKKYNTGSINLNMQGKKGKR